MSKGGRGEKSIDRLSWLQEITEPPSTVPVKGPGTRMSENPNQWKTGVGIIVSPDLDEI